jgi:hypothetical protein
MGIRALKIRALHMGIETQHGDFFENGKNDFDQDKVVKVSHI